MTAMPSSNMDVNTRPSRASMRRITTLVTLGNVLEWYDFSVYAVVAIYLAANFFPKQDAVAALLPTFAVFGAAFLARPLGALILGPMMDRKGRKSVMLVSMLLMAGGSILIGVTPGFATLGIFGAVLVVIGRLAQGFSTGGEFGSAAVFMSEWAPDGRRGFYVSFTQVATNGGLILGLGFASILTFILGPENMLAWGWRIPFLFGGLLAVLVFILRRHLDETPVFRSIQQPLKSESADGLPGSETVRGGNVRAFFTTMGVVLAWTMTAFVVLNYMPAYAVTFIGIDQQSALIATGIGAVVSLVLIPVAGALSDRVGRRPLIIIGSVALVVLCYPMFVLMGAMHSFVGVLLAQVILAPVYAALAGVGPATITELFGTRRRGSLVSVASALTIVLFGGFGPFIVTWLIQTTGTTTAPAFYLIGGGILTLITALTLPRRLGFGALRD